MNTDWEALASTSHYQTAVAIRNVLQAGDVAEATAGLEELIDALSRSDERALESYLIRLMQHIIKWQVQPERRSPRWVATIDEARRQIRKLQQRHPRFTDRYIREEAWEDAYAGGVNEAIRDLNRTIPNPPPLSWEEVFEREYRTKG
jgi:hypothetical protein